MDSATRSPQPVWRSASGNPNRIRPFAGLDPAHQRDVHQPGERLQDIQAIFPCDQLEVRELDRSGKCPQACEEGTRSVARATPRPLHGRAQ